jgi:hypothetical protein
MDAHDREYAAAAAGMAEVYGTNPDEPCSLPSIGDRVAWRTKAMSDTDCESGRVVLIVTGLGRRAEIVVEQENGQALRVIDPRPWPTGNLLPF